MLNEGLDLAVANVERQAVVWSNRKIEFFVDSVQIAKPSVGRHDTNVRTKYVVESMVDDRCLKMMMVMID